MGHSFSHKNGMAPTNPHKIRLLAPGIAFFATLLTCLTSIPQTQDSPVGKVIERVVCLKDASQSYALYLPPDYAPDRRWQGLERFPQRPRRPADDPGFTNADEIVGKPDFASISNDASYKQLVEDARRKAQSEQR